LSKGELGNELEERWCSESSENRFSSWPGSFDPGCWWNGYARYYYWWQLEVLEVYMHDSIGVIEKGCQGTLRVVHNNHAMTCFKKWCWLIYSNWGNYFL